MKETEIQRERWRRVRHALDLVDVESEGFAAGGLASHVQDLSVRFLILPTDPELEPLLFGEDFWLWFLEDQPNPFGGRATDWGREHRPSAGAAIRFDPRADEWRWDLYLAIHRSGALEFGLGSAGGFEFDGQRYFRLIEIVGRLWWSMYFYAAARERLDIEGPWECALAMRGTKGADLGNLGEGWRDPADRFGWTPPKCPDPHVLLRHEIAVWPEGDAIQALAFEFGDRIEDAWGMRNRRYLAQRGEREAQFDIACYGR